MMNKERGVTILEVLLVLVIMTSLILMGLRWYQTLQTENNYGVLKSDVDQLFLALRQYYQANCGTINNGTANPNNIFFPKSGTISSFVTPPASGLQPYLPSNWPRHTPIIDTASDNGFTSQFNLYLPASKLPQKVQYVCYNFGTPACSTQAPIPNSQIFIWQMQVAVKMLNPTEAYEYRATAGADCAASDISGGPIVCSDNASIDPANATYLIWQRAPSDVPIEMRSPLWMYDPVLKEFKLQYTHDPMYEMYNPNTTIDYTQPPMDRVSYQNYLCGG